MIQEIDGVLDDAVTDITIITEGTNERTANQGTGVDPQQAQTNINVLCFCQQVIRLMITLSDCFAFDATSCSNT